MYARVYESAPMYVCGCTHTHTHIHSGTHTVIHDSKVLQQIVSHGFWDPFFITLVLQPIHMCVSVSKIIVLIHRISQNKIQSADLRGEGALRFAFCLQQDSEFRGLLFSWLLLHSLFGNVIAPRGQLPHE